MRRCRCRFARRYVATAKHGNYSFADNLTAEGIKAAAGGCLTEFFARCRIQIDHETIDKENRMAKLAVFSPEDFLPSPGKAIREVSNYGPETRNDGTDR